MTYGEYRKKYQNVTDKKEEKNTTRGTYDQYREKYKDTYGEQLIAAGADLESFQKELSSYMASAQKSAESMGYDTYQQAWETHYGTANSLLSKASSLKQTYSANRDLLDEESYNELMG